MLKNSFTELQRCR